MTGQDVMDREDRIQEIRDRIQAQFPDIEFPEPVTEPIYYGRLKKKKYSGRNAILDANTGTPWDIVSDSYHVVTHEELIWDMLQAVPEEYGKPAVDIIMWQEAARIRVNMYFPELGDQDAEIKPGDKVRPRITGYSSYDRSTYHGMFGGAEQMVCSNGLIAFRQEAAKKRKHIIHSSVTQEQLSEEIQNFMIDYSESVKLWQKWADRKLAKLEFEEVMEALPFSEAEQEKILQLPLMNHEDQWLSSLDSPTLWDVSSAATQFARHEVRGKQRANDLEMQIAQVLAKV